MNEWHETERTGEQATFFSGLSPSAAVDVFRSLDKACQNFAVASDLHALVLVTPLDGIEPDWGRFREEYLACSKDDPVRVVGELVSENPCAKLVRTRPCLCLSLSLSPSTVVYCYVGLSAVSALLWRA